MDELSEESYQQFITIIKKTGYTFSKFSDFGLNNTSALPRVLLRHDIDFDIRSAVRIAEIEDELQILSTYFLQLHSPLYNALSKGTINAMNAINAQGHDIGLHMDPHYYDVADIRELPRAVESHVIQEIDLLSRYYPFANTKIVSIHRPGTAVNLLESLTLPHGIRHTYEKAYFTDIAYFSDSRGEWQYGHPLSSQNFQQRKPMQLLTHPMWWCQAGNTPLQKIASYVRASCYERLDDMERTTVSIALDGLRPLTVDFGGFLGDR